MILKEVICHIKMTNYTDKINALQSVNVLSTVALRKNLQALVSDHQ